VARTLRTKIGGAVRNEIIRRVREGEPNQVVFRDILGRNSNYNQNEIRAAIRSGVQQRTTTERFRRNTQRTFGTIQELSGCTPSQNVVIALEMAWDDARTGNPRSFIADVDAEAGAVQVRQHLARAARDLLRYARQFESIVRSLGDAVVSQDIKFRVVSVRCI
jgi:hypothetical protein